MARLLAAALLLCVPAAALAGMPSPAVLNELPKMRLQAISFFLAGFLLSALLVRWLWNALRNDLAWMPRLSYGGAVGLVTLWGLLFILVLTMISGARELMTPGAWEPDGVTYKLPRKAEPPPRDESMEAERRMKLGRLKDALWKYAKANEGRLPPSRTDPAIAEESWRVPGPSGMQYVYAGGALSAHDPKPLAHEPEVFPGGRLVLFSDGAIKELPADELRRLLAGG